MAGIGLSFSDTPGDARALAPVMPTQPSAPTPQRGPAPDWDAMVQRYDRAVWLKLLALRVPPDRAEDLKQMVWEKLIGKWQRGELQYLQMPGLALQQAEFIARQSWRKSKCRGTDNVLELSDKRVASLAGDGEQHVLNRAILQKAFSLVRAASPMARQVFQLTYRPPGKTANQVGQHLGISEQRVRQILCELRARLRKSV